MADDREQEQGQDRTYEAPAVEPLGSAEELAKGNEGSMGDNATGG